MPAVLVAEECPEVLWVVVLLLSRAGYAVQEAASWPEALAACRPGAFAVALLDVGMGGMSGPAILAALRAADPALRCVLMGCGRYTDEELLAFGADAYLAKPFAPDELLAVVSRVAGPP
jgi:CheY-like chemotaxis protein